MYTDGTNIVEGDCPLGWLPCTPEQIETHLASKAFFARAYEIKAELISIDQKRIRPLAEGDVERLTSLNTQAQALRLELSGL